MDNNSYNNENNYAPPAYAAQVIPPEVGKWNWGAFMFNVYWGVANNALMALLCLVPFFGIVWMFICGAKGNTWAWKSGKFKDIETFVAIQETWSRAGLLSFVFSLASILLCIIISIFFIYFFITLEGFGIFEEIFDPYSRYYF